jgi:hypothetical protein
VAVSFVLVLLRVVLYTTFTFNSRNFFITPPCGWEQLKLKEELRLDACLRAEQE